MLDEEKGKEKQELYKNIGNRLLVKRRELYYTQEQVAELLGVSAGFYGMIERGEKAPSIEKLVVIYEKLGIDITYLLTGDDRKEQVIDGIGKCPKEKWFEFQQLMKSALNLANMK